VVFDHMMSHPAIYFCLSSPSEVTSASVFWLLTKFFVILLSISFFLFLFNMSCSNIVYDLEYFFKFSYLLLRQI
jgi:hypothetical protein